MNANVNRHILPYLLLDTLAKLWVDLFASGEDFETDCANISCQAIALAGESDWLKAMDKAMGEAGIIDFPVVE